MKKVLVCLICVVMLLSLTIGCKKNNSSAQGTDEAAVLESTAAEQEITMTVNTQEELDSLESTSEETPFTDSEFVENLEPSQVVDEVKRDEKTNDAETEPSVTEALKPDEIPRTTNPPIIDLGTILPDDEV